MTRRRTFSLSAIVTAALVSVTTVLVGAAGTAQYVQASREQWYLLRHLTWLQANAVAVALEVPVWNIDREQIEKVIDAMSEPHSMYAITVTSAGVTQGVVRNAEWKYVPWKGGAMPPGLIGEHRDIVYNGHRTGTVSLYVTPRFLEGDLRMLRMKLIATVVIIDALLILCTYLVLWRAVLRPVVAMQRYAVDISSGGMPAEARTTSVSELDSLRRSIEDMVHLLDQRYADLQQEAVRRFESEDRFHTIFDSVNDAIMIHEPATSVILDANARFTELTGYSSEEARHVTGKLSSNVGDFKSATAQQQIRTLPDGEILLLEWEIRHKDGHMIPVELSFRAARIGGERRVIAVMRDITQRKSMEAALRQSERMSTIGSLVAGVAHEVRNPLFGIAATMEAFESEFGSGNGVDEYMTVLRADLARLTNLMNDLLEYGRARPLQTHRQSLAPLIAEAVRICTPRANQRHIAIDREVAEGLPLIDIDSERMLQVVKNVVENAVEFSEPGEAVAIRVHAERNGSESVVCTVSDRGPGFSAGDLPHVFEPFFTRRRGGSGLGLAIAQRIVSEHGGTIAAANEPAGGARIEIRLPAAGSG